MPSTRRLRVVGPSLVVAAATAATMAGGPAALAEEPTAPSISELHYDNVGTDTGEAIEVEAPTGFDLTGWQLALYNGNGGAVYDTRTLSGAVDDTGVTVATYPTDGIQNGSPDAVALVRPDGTVAEFLSYEGQLAASNGPAAGTTATDLGVAEASTTPVGHSLQKVDGVWQAPAPNSFGARNTPGEDPGPDPVGCDLTVTNTIAEVQGTGDASPLAGSQVVVEGVVTADHRTGGYNGVYVQTAGSGDRAPEAGVASDAVFVYLTTNSANHPGVAVGDQVRVRGTVSEYFGLTQITIGARADVQVCANDAPLPAVVPLALPADAAARESVESMVVAPVGDFTVSEVYNTNRFGEVVLAAGTEAARIPTDLHRPGTPEAKAAATANTLGRVLVDDGRTTNLSNAGEAPPYVYPDAPLRVGDSVEAFGPSVLSYGFDEWRLQPATPVTATTPAIDRTTFKSTNPRTPGPEAVGGDIRLASFNVLNYFVHFGGDARGADDEAGLAKQQAKIVSAIGALDADVVALEEIENSVRFEDNDPQLALRRLVEALNAAQGAGTWDYVRTPTELPGAAQQDFITTAIIFKPAAVTPKGESRSINDETVWFNAREPIAQTFTSGDATFTVVVNHLKSKSSSDSATGDNADAGDGQGAFNGDRVRQARSLVSFVDGLKADSGSEDVLLLGDFNAYTQEDPMAVLYDASYVDLNDTGKSSYVFGGESGSLDHAVASPSLAGRVTGVDVWQINSHESYAFQYDGLPAFYAEDPYRASDHNPIVVGLSTGSAGPVELNLLSINDFHGRLESLGTDDNGAEIGGAAQLAGFVNAQRAANPNTLFLSGGDNIGASTFVSAIDDDNPTLDALNLIGVDAAAVGNHEFDKGMTDLTDRVIPRAEFSYLGANVYRGDERALPAHEVKTVGGVRVGIVGVVTEQTASLVSPDGIAGLTFRDPVAEAELVAGQLKDGDEANGEADVVVLLAHEGAATENIGSVEDLRADPVFGEFMDLSANVDVLMSGHTHQPYAFTAPIPGSERLRPVIQAQEYGRKLGKATLTVDGGEIVASGAELLDVVGGTPDPAVAQLVADAKANADVLGQRPLGSITADVTRARGADGTEDRGAESTLGNFVADVQLAGTAEEGRGGAQIALMNPGGLRADLTHAPDGVVTYAEAFSVQPFANDVVTASYTGAQLKQVLEEQWQPAGASRPKLHLGVSKGFAYTYLPDNPAGERITSMTLNGESIDPAATYRVTVNSFLASGGDNFFTLAEGTDRATTGDNDLTMLTAYLAANSPVTADPESRATIGAPEPECTETITGLRLWKVEVTSGQTCLEDAVVLGSVTVRGGGSLSATDGTILGTLTASGAGDVSVSGTDLLGVVSITGSTGEVTVEGAGITGTVALRGNLGAVRLDGATVTGPVTLTGNRGGSVVAGNRIVGVLSCQNNDPAPTDDGRPNTVRGAVSGQCRQL
ncbi:ExeM/NucH family extracellular endonuclease [Actinophytocola xinjiangensis]|uniref:ExeM/NucH family extracellular endonuclease n=1 Tax=Actinophytocola xinjiangensis TaxID=485602 RepID=UPI000ABC65F9|nr:ExeM/NucH family extracellular endonuclease [Actinophytocola xinjiangensis]